MTRTILIPTDFSVRSLILVKEAMNRSSDEKVNIILLHGIILSDSITELMFFSKPALMAELETEEFKASIRLIQNKFYSRIVSIYVDIFTGVTQSAFENYVAANNIDEAYVAFNYEWQQKHKRSFDLLPFFRKTKIPVNALEEYPSHLMRHEVDQLETLFFQKFINQSLDLE